MQAGLDLTGPGPRGGGRAVEEDGGRFCAAESGDSEEEEEGEGACVEEEVGVDIEEGEMQRDWGLKRSRKVEGKTP